jgi:UDP-N-acetylmuramoylalanine--D-glutamate ligase
MLAAEAMQMTDATERVLILGLGKTGLSVARHLAASGIGFAIADSRAQPPGLADLERELPEVPVHLGPFAPDRLRGASTLIASPGVSLKEPAVQAALEAGVEVIGDIELFARRATAPIVAITGSNGKSTVTALVEHLGLRSGLRAAAGGNIGTPALDLLGTREPDLYVLEVSSFQLETTQSLTAAAAVVLNLSADHLDRYVDMAEYAAAKGRIYRGARACIVNRDDPVARALADGRESSSFGLDVPAEGQFGVIEHLGDTWLAFGAQPLLRESELLIRGRHNTANALAALALGHAVGLPISTMISGLRDFAGLEHRTQWVASIDGVDWYNDSKATNVGAALAALNGFETAVVLIAGGIAKGQDFSALREVVAAKARAVVVFGRDAALIEAALEGCAPLARVEGLEAAVQAAHELAQPGDTVLLAPACASFDMFSGFEERGQRFVELVRGLGQ